MLTAMKISSITIITTANILPLQILSRIKVSLKFSFSQSSILLFKKIWQLHLNLTRLVNFFQLSYVYYS